MGSSSSDGSIGNGLSSFGNWVGGGIEDVGNSIGRFFGEITDENRIKRKRDNKIRKDKDAADYKTFKTAQNLKDMLNSDLQKSLSAQAIRNSTPVTGKSADSVFSGGVSRAQADRDFLGL